MAKHDVVDVEQSDRPMRRRVAGVTAIIAASATAFVVVAPSASAASISVSTPVQLKAALLDGTNDTVVLGGNISITDGTRGNVSQTLAKTLDLHGQTLTINSVGANLAAIRVAGTASLTIEDTIGTGSLDVTGGSNGAGIGGDQTESASSISVISGSVTAHGGGTDSAGIGGGGNNGATPGGSGGTQIYSGGTTSATGGSNGAGIGGGTGGSGATLTVSGSASVTAHGGSGAGGAGIGGGAGGAGISTTISNGSVSATGGSGGAGIGGGSTGVGGTVAISGGTVNAQGGGQAAGIGGGAGAGGGTQTYSGGSTTATGGTSGAGVGGGTNGVGGSITVSGDPNPQTAATILVAQGGTDAAGIGGGDSGNGGTLSISGSAVQATGGTNGAGVGGGDNGNGATVSVSAGALVATGGTNGAGIGGGHSGNGGSLTTSVTGSNAGAVSATDGGSTSSAVGAGAGGSTFGTLANGGGLTIPTGATLRIPSGATATNTGSVLCKGTITAGATAGTLQNDGLIFLSGGTIQGDGDGGAGIVTVSVHNYKLVFDSNGGPSPNPTPAHVYATTMLAANVSLPTVSPPSGGIFLGWYTAASGGSQVTTSTDLSTLIAPGPTTFTLFAHYRLPQTITFPIIGNQTFGAPDFQVNATASSSLPVTFSASPSSVCTITSGGLLHIVAAGSCTVFANQAGNTNFLPAPQAARSFTVLAGIVTVTATGSQTYRGQATLVPTGSLPAGVTLAGTLSCTTLTNGSTIKPTLLPGSYTINSQTCGGVSLTGPNSGNFTMVFGNGSFIVNAANLDVIVTGTQTYQSSTATFSKSYTPPPNVTVSGALTCLRVQPSTNIDANLAVGSYTVQGSSCSGLSLGGSEGPGYQIFYVGNTFTVTPQPIVVTATGTEPYGGTPTFTPVATLPSGITLAGTLSCTKLTGNIPITPSLAVNSHYIIDSTTCSGLTPSGTGSSNYVVTYANGNFTVTKGSVVVVTHTNSAANANSIHKFVFTTTVTNAQSGLPVANVKVTITVQFNQFFKVTCTGFTNASGVATCSSGNGNLFISPGHAYTATTPASSNYNAGTGNGHLGS